MSCSYNQLCWWKCIKNNLINRLFPSRLMTTLLSHEIKINDKVISHFLLYLLLSTSNYTGQGPAFMSDLPNEWFLKKCHHSSCVNIPSVLGLHLFLLPEKGRISEGHFWWAKEPECVPRSEMPGRGLTVGFTDRFAPEKKHPFQYCFCGSGEHSVLKLNASSGLFQLGALWNRQGGLGNKTLPVRPGRNIIFFSTWSLRAQELEGSSPSFFPPLQAPWCQQLCRTHPGHPCQPTTSKKIGSKMGKR